MNLRQLFRSFNLENVKINSQGPSVELSFKPEDKNAAWELYVEMLTRITTQALPSKKGDEQAALKSVYSLFPTTRQILRQRGRKTIEFTKVAIPVLNQIVRPFTTKWHKESLDGAFKDKAKRREFRDELKKLQGRLQNYNRMLAEIAGVEDLTDLEDAEEDR